MQETDIIINFINKLNPNIQQDILKDLISNNIKQEQVIHTYKRILKHKENSIKVIADPQRNVPPLGGRFGNNVIDRQLKIETIDREVKSFDIPEAARELNRKGIVIGSKRLYLYLNDKGFIYKKNSSSYLPSREMILNNYMIADHRTSFKTDGKINKYSVVLITKKGIDFIAESIRNIECII